MAKFEPALSLKIYSGTPEQTAKNIACLKWPYLSSVKWDGWRMFDTDGKATCRSLKPPRNTWVQDRLRLLYEASRDHGFSGLDGEILVGDVMDKNVMQATTSVCNSYDGRGELTYMTFDLFDKPNLPAIERDQRLQELIRLLSPEFPWVRYTPQEMVHSYEEACRILDGIIAAGGEGIMGKCPNSLYKFGRATQRQPDLWALKPYADAEADILGYEEEMQNNNEQTLDERGYSKRSGHKANLVGKDTMGKAICSHPDFAETFSVGAGVGLTADLRREIWHNQEKYLTRTTGVKLKFKYMEIGVKDRPRQPKWMGLRYPEDMG